VVNLRLKALAPAGSVSFAQLAAGFLRTSGEAGADEGTRTAYFGPKIGERETRILPRTGLIGKSLEGPVVLEEFDTTVVVPVGWSASLDQYGNIILEALG
jgi:N-methylhydantoinase A